MTWYAAYTVRHELIGTLSVRDNVDVELKEQKYTVLHGTERLVCTVFNLHAPVSSTFPMRRVIVKLEEIVRSYPTGDPMRPYERETMFHYVTIDDPADLMSTCPMDPKFDWIGATFVPLGAPLMCEYCPDRKEGP